MNSETLLHRQINPAWIQNGRPTSQAFCPTPKDDLQLSVYDGDLIDPAESFEHFTEVQKLNSAGVQAVTPQDCEQNGVVAAPDPAPFPEHAVIDFTSVESGSGRKKVAKQLQVAARERGWVYQPNED